MKKKEVRLIRFNFNKFEKKRFIVDNLYLFCTVKYKSTIIYITFKYPGFTLLLYALH